MIELGESKYLVFVIESFGRRANWSANDSRLSSANFFDQREDRAQALRHEAAAANLSRSNLACY